MAFFITELILEHLSVCLDPPFKVYDDSVHQALSHLIVLSIPGLSSLLKMLTAPQK